MSAVAEVHSSTAWTFALGGWQLHLRAFRGQRGGAGLDMCTIPPVYVADRDSAGRVLGELARVIHGFADTHGGKLPATQEVLVLLVPVVRTWLEDAARRGALTWAPGPVELFCCRCPDQPAPQSALDADPDFPRDAPPEGA